MPRPRSIRSSARSASQRQTPRGAPWPRVAPATPLPQYSLLLLFTHALASPETPLEPSPPTPFRTQPTPRTADPRYRLP